MVPNSFELRRVEKALFHEGAIIFDPCGKSLRLLRRQPAFEPDNDKQAQQDQANEDDGQEHPCKIEPNLCRQGGANNWRANVPHRCTSPTEAKEVLVA